LNKEVLFKTDLGSMMNIELTEEPERLLDVKKQQEILN
jgi:hypothetical protein